MPMKTMTQWHIAGFGIAVAIAAAACSSSDSGPQAAGGSSAQAGSGGSSQAGSGGWSQAGSAGSQPDPKCELTEQRSSVSRDTSPVVSAADRSALATGNAEFGFALYGQRRAESGNFILSPISASIALAMTYAGAKGTTEQEMAAALHFKLPQEKLHPAFNALDLELAKRSAQDVDPANGSPLILSIANSLWGQTGYPFLPTFLDTVGVNYGAGMSLVDYKTDPEAARIAINNWVSCKTKQKIEELIPAGIINKITRLVLTNAIYFKGSWEEPFHPGGTADAPFHTLNSGDVVVSMMSGKQEMVYAEDADYQAVDLPYKGGSDVMTLVLPTAGRFDAVEAALSNESLTTMLQKMSRATVNIKMPKFQFKTAFKLTKALKALGMPTAFESPGADFSAMGDYTKTDEILFIQDVIQQAYIGVDEKGTEAAAATAVVMGGVDASAPPPPKQIVLDRPFLFFIRDNPTGAILFAGRVMNPSAN
jgi:serpin B